MTTETTEHSLMSRPAVLRALAAGEITISPFDKKNLGTNSYDFCLGDWFWREKDIFDRTWIYNPYSEKSVRAPG